MATIARNRARVKGTRRTHRPDRPFGAGILAFVPFAVVAPGFAEPEAEDREWWARESNRLPGPMERAWEERFERAVANGEACARCGLEPEPGDRMAGGHCFACSTDILEAEHLDRLAMASRAIEPADSSGSCGACGRACDYLEGSGLCCPCDLRATDLCTTGNGGY